eukprot:6172952-Pleurochrysis_carterae.AAC.2
MAFRRLYLQEVQPSQNNIEGTGQSRQTGGCYSLVIFTLFVGVALVRALEAVEPCFVTTLIEGN